ncbi:MAG: hypothetical protein LQ345_001120 [Seirophora villosa]|nr:MAG: hypothetical protein LQ345_001120 [Seirophora villosa]
MSSIFTFDPDPPKTLSSPWPVLSAEQHNSAFPGHRQAGTSEEIPSITHLADFGIKELEPEPQNGPTEYKLHLLLRPRRSFSALSTVQKVSGSHLSKSHASRSETGTNATLLPLPRIPSAPAASTQSRQSRLQNLTTQLLWRLQQSSPHHSAFRSDLIVPALPEAVDGMSLPGPTGRILPGLGDSQGALYEIGVADDGSLVGLTDDELAESLAVLRAMASSLGCRVSLLRRIMVGDCQWFEPAGGDGTATSKLRKEKLWVSEALVVPVLDDDRMGRSITQALPPYDSTIATPSTSCSNRRYNQQRRADQLRVSLTGNTTSGKSSLLGTLSTSTLDNGRGKSRLSLLKHRHEIASGVTSSVTGSLIGYHDGGALSGDRSCVRVINYASGNVSSWTDIHSASDPGRLVLLNDSAGHPRFRRTTVRGLVSWAPHWTICCIAADNDEDTRGKAGATASASDILGSACAEIDLAKAHLELCLLLRLPLIVVITKLDLASMSALKPTLGKILSVLKAAGRRPEILSCPSQDNSFHTQIIDHQSEDEVIQLLSSASESDACLMVPIVLTSAVTGKGMDKLHALLRHLPIPERPHGVGELVSLPTAPVSPSSVFHIDEIFATHSAQSSGRQASGDISIDSVLSGHLRRGSLAVGQEVIIGPFIANSTGTDALTPEVHRANLYPKVKGSPKANTASRILPRPLFGDSIVTPRTNTEAGRASAVWRRVTVCSIRNLRLPVHNLLSDQAGTVGLGPSNSSVDTDPGPLTPEDRIRKGMVLMYVPDPFPISTMQAYGGFVAIIESTGTSAYHPGSSVIAYIASIRAPAKVLDSRMLPQHAPPPGEVFDYEDDTGEIASAGNASSTEGKNRRTQMTCQFSTSQEWFELGSRVLVMPASGFGTAHPTAEKSDKFSAGLEGHVGTIVHGIE